MAAPAITSSIFQQIQNYQQQGRADVKELAAALKSGNLGAAKQAFNDLTSLAKNPPLRNTDGARPNPQLVQAFEAIGQALQADDLAGAQSAFANLKNTLAGKNTATSAQFTSPAVIVNIGQNNASSAVSDTESIYQQLQDFRNARKSDLSQLGTALQSGNTKAAQKLYATLVALGKSGPFSNGATFRRADRAQDFAAIGTALQSGNLAGARIAFADLQATFEKPLTPPKEPPVPAPTSGPIPEVIINFGGGGDKGGNNPELVVNIGSNFGSSTPEELQINLGGKLGGSDGGKLTIDISPTKNGIGEHIAIDFLQQNNDYRIAVDILNPSSTQANPLSLHA